VNDLIDHLLTIIRTSEFLGTVASVRADGGLQFALGDCRVRPLVRGEITQLEAAGSRADDWSRVLVAEGFDARRVERCRFHGDVVLGRFAGRARLAGGLELPTGLSGSTLADCVVGHNAFVQDVRLLHNYVVGPHAVLFDCGRFSCELRVTFGNGTPLTVGPQTGGRSVPALAELDVALAAAAVGSGNSRSWRADFDAAAADYVARATAGRGVIGPGVRVEHAGQVVNSFLGTGARVDGASLLRDCTLLGSDEEPVRVGAGACLERAMARRGSSVDTMSVVRRAVLAEHASVERQGKVTDSLLGPCTAVGAGEVSSCLLGPLVSAHHQSLLIATLWPGGRGNVGYGANVGSNHTSRAPDQEFRAGEGLFIGLGANFQFPIDLSGAPYSVIACGTDLEPQRVRFPFALIRKPLALPPGVPASHNEIIPAWVLAENLFALRRNEAKYRSRYRAGGAAPDLRILRPETVGLMRDGLHRLERCRSPKDVYTARDIDGLGKNFLSEAARQQAIRSYLFHLRLYALLGLHRQVRQALCDGRPEATGSLLPAPAAEPGWEQQRRILVEEFRLLDARSALRQLPPLLQQFARAVESSRAKDDVRGTRVIDDYADVHAPADRDAVVRQTWDEARRLQAEVEELIGAPGADAAPPELPACALNHLSAQAAPACEP
jgi:hypothetical protein